MSQYQMPIFFLKATYDFPLQVQAWSKRGLSVACVTSDCASQVKAKVLAGEYQLVFFTPELLITKTKWRELLLGDVYKARIKALVVDEAHCVKKW